MRQTSEISKLTSLRVTFVTVALTTLVACCSAQCFAGEADPMLAAPMASIVPGKPKADAAAGEALYSNGDPARGVTACIGCHGPNGKSASGTWPKLAAQHAAYITKQLSNFQDGSRVNPIMSAMAAPLKQEDMQNIAAYLTKQEPILGVAQDKTTIELGQSIYRGGIASKGVPACAGCHSPNGVGIPAQYPRLAGQWAEYSNTQLMTFRDGSRKNGPAMSVIAAKLSDVEMKAVADYMAGLH